MPVGKSLHPLCGQIIEVLLKERERQKLSKYVVAQRSGLSQSMIARVERGTRIPTLDTVLRMADALGMDLAAVIRRAQRAAAKSKGK